MCCARITGAKAAPSLYWPEQNQNLRRRKALILLDILGASMLYADLGHFGRYPIRRVWFSFVLPALLPNYFGQGALMIAEPTTTLHPFFHLAPEREHHGRANRQHHAQLGDIHWQDKG
jgi:hypothetical protein